MGQEGHRSMSPIVEYLDTKINEKMAMIEWSNVKQIVQRKLRGSIHMKFSMTGKEKGDLLIQVTASANFTV
jgi:hypothetical protein